MSIHGEEQFEAHVYLDHDFQPIQWNIVRGVFSSVGCYQGYEQHNFIPISISMASMLLNDSLDRLRSEQYLEHIRSDYYSENVSRLSGVFVFDDLESVSQHWNNNNWGQHFQDEYLADVGVDSYKSSRLDSNWISEIIDDTGRLLPNCESAAHSYWQGIPHPDREPIWERIVEGTICVWTSESKNQALLNLSVVWPESLNLLNYAIQCGHYGSLEGETISALILNENNIRLSYFIRMSQYDDPMFIEGLSDFIENNPRFNSSLRFEGVDKLPDLSIYSRTFEPFLTTRIAEIGNV